MLTLIKGQLDQEMKTQLGVMGLELRELNDEKTFVGYYDGSSLSIANRPLTGNINEKTVIVNERYIPVVEGIKKNYKDELGFINPRRILFLEDIAWEQNDRTTKNSDWKSQLTRAPKSIADMFGYDYVFKTRKFYNEKLSESQEAAMIMAELLRIDKEKGAIEKPTIESYSLFTSTFGQDWLGEGAGNIPNVSEEKVELIGMKKANGQLSIYKVCEITDQADKE